MHVMSSIISNSEQHHFQRPHNAVNRWAAKDGGREGKKGNSERKEEIWQSTNHVLVPGALFGSFLPGACSRVYYICV